MPCAEDGQTLIVLEPPVLEEPNWWKNPEAGFPQDVVARASGPVCRAVSAPTDCTSRQWEVVAGSPEIGMELTFAEAKQYMGTVLDAGWVRGDCIETTTASVQAPKSEDGGLSVLPQTGGELMVLVIIAIVLITGGVALVQSIKRSA